MPEFVLSATVEAPADKVYELIAEQGLTVRFFPYVVHSVYLERSDSADRVRRWTLAGDQPLIHRATTTQMLDPEARRISFRHEEPPEGLESVTGEWCFAPEEGNRTTVLLTHQAAGNRSALYALEHGAGRALAALAAVAAQRDQLEELEVFYEASLEIDAALEDLFDYFYRAERWPGNIPHCLAVDKREDPPGAQIVQMDVRVPSGAVHTTRQARVCLANDRIAWRQIGGLPPLDQALHGYTSFHPTANGRVLVKAGQTELLRPEAVAKRGWTVQQAKDHVAEVRAERNLNALHSAQDYLQRRSERGAKAANR
jgi:ribosome-associated toxin RatA of RatAB toxin-antitoxin module